MVNQPTGADQFSIPIPFPNSKPWINRDIKVLWYRKRRAFMAGDKEDTQREIQRELRRELRWAKDCYKNKIEGKLQQNNPREVGGRG